jgi:Helix-turn-helix domain
METRESVTLDARAQHRLFVLTQVLEGRVSIGDAARLLERSERQVKRLLTALREEGAAGLIHGNRGRTPVHRTPDGLRARLVELATTTVRHNARFAVEPADPEPAWRPWPRGREPASVFCFQYPRRVANDATIAWAGGSLALPERPGRRSWAGCAVILEERLDGSLWARHDGTSYPVSPAPAHPALLRARSASRRSAGKPDYEPQPLPGRASAAWRPPADHPWRR